MRFGIDGLTLDDSVPVEVIFDLVGVSYFVCFHCHFVPASLAGPPTALGTGLLLSDGSAH